MSLKKLRQFDPQEIVHAYGYDATNNEIYIQGAADYAAGCLGDEVYEEPGVEYIMANRFVINMQMALAAGKDGNSYKPLLIHMKTNGGDWNQGIAMYDLVKSYPGHVTIVNYTYARSMSSLLFQAADRRIMFPNSDFMFHEGDYGDSGTMKTVKSNLAFYDTKHDVMLDIYIHQLRRKGLFKNKPKKDIKKWLQDQMDKKENVWLNSRQTVEHGFADELFTSWKSVRDTNKNIVQVKEEPHVTRGHKGLKRKDRCKRSPRRI